MYCTNHCILVFIICLLTTAEESKGKPPCPLAPRPKELIDLFIDKKHEIEEKLSDSNTKPEEIKLMNSTRRQRARRADDNEWIAILKGELNQRNALCKEKVKQHASVRAPYKSPFADPDEHRKSKSFRCESREREYKMSKPKDVADTYGSGKSSSSFKCAPCIRCEKPVALVDKIVISGHVIHRSCLTCSKCGVTLRLSEVRNCNFLDDVDLTHLNYLCLLCSKNKVNSFSNLATSSSCSHVITGKPPLDCITVPDTNGTCKSRPRSPVSSLHSRLEQEKVHQQSMASFAATDEYELKLKERMRWKEQFLMNNNNDFDLGSLIHRQIVKSKENDHQNKEQFKSLAVEVNRDETNGDVTDSSTGSNVTSESSKDTSNDKGANSNNKIDERIEYENTSRTRELFDDDELTKLLNLESDQWQSGEDEEEEPSTSSTTSETDQRSEDSTEADFDSDEAFDASTASKLKSQPLSPEVDEIPDIVVECTPESTLDDEIGTATGDEIDTAGELDASKNATHHIVVEHVENDHSSSDSDTLAGGKTDSILIGDEEKVKLLNSSATSQKSSTTNSDEGKSLSSNHTESEIWSESHNRRNNNEPKKLAKLAEIESIAGSFEALPLIDHTNNDLSPGKDISCNEAINGSPVITKSYTTSPSTFESKSSYSTISSPSYSRSISEATSTANTLTSPSNVRSILSCNVTSITESDSHAESDTLIATPHVNYARYSGLSDVTDNSCKDDDKLINSITQLTTTNHTNSTGNNTSRQVDSSLLFASNSLFASHASDSHRVSSASHGPSSLSNGVTNKQLTNTESRVKSFSSKLNNTDNQVKCSSFSPSTSSSSASSFTPSLGFRVAQPKITKFNLDYYKLPISNGSENSSNSITSDNDSVDLTIDRHQTKQTLSVVSCIDDSSQVTTDISTNGSVPASESYSRIPVLSKRTLPAYRGSFTDKLLERCRSTPSLDGSPDARKLSIASPPISMTGDTPPKVHNSVLAKWACSNLLQMSTHEIGATPKLPFLSPSERKSNVSSPLNIGLPRHSSSYFMSTCQASENDDTTRAQADSDLLSHSLIYQKSPSSMLKSESKERQQQSTLELPLRSRLQENGNVRKLSQPIDSSTLLEQSKVSNSKSVYNHSPTATTTADTKVTQATMSHLPPSLSSFSSLSLASSSLRNQQKTSPLSTAKDMPFNATATNTCSPSTNGYSRLRL